MALVEALDVFLAEFGVSVTDGTTATTGILDRPGEVIAGGQVVSIEYALTVKSSAYPSLKFGDALTVDGASYTVRHVQPADDGAFSLVYLSKD
jgi:riboflavin synthase alpha subunit